MAMYVMCGWLSVGLCLFAVVFRLVAPPRVIPPPSSSAKHACQVERGLDRSFTRTHFVRARQASRLLSDVGVSRFFGCACLLV